MRRFYIYTIIAGLFFCTLPSSAQHKVGSELEFDKLTHNFGDIVHKSGPVTCVFTVKNSGDKPAMIYNVVTTCGCTDVKWTREPIRPGSKGKISITYSNDEGAYPFDKTLTVYTSDSKKPILLKIRGISTEGKKPLSSLYPITFGPLGIRENNIKCGNLEQGGHKSEAVLVANLSSSPIRISFTDISQQLKVRISPNPIPANSTAEMSFTITADRALWGKNSYYATPLINGKTYASPNGERLSFWAFTKERFSNMTQEQISNGSKPVFENSTYTFGQVKRGFPINAEFMFKNEGKDDFHVYKIDTDTDRLTCSNIPDVSYDKEGAFNVHLDTSELPIGEHLTIVTLTTNSPTQPIINLFIAGFITK